MAVVDPNETNGLFTREPNRDRLESVSSSRWEFLRHENGLPTNVRVLRGTTIIEVMHKGEKKLFDIADYLPIAP